MICCSRILYFLFLFLTCMQPTSSDHIASSWDLLILHWVGPQVAHRERAMEKKKILCEMKKQLKLAGPLILANGMQFILQVISNMFVGHLGELALSGASMATSFAGVTGFSLLVFFFTLYIFFLWFFWCPYNPFFKIQSEMHVFLLEIFFKSFNFFICN